MTHCYSCGAIAEKGQPNEKTYCQYCIDNDGQLKDREAIKNGVAGWLSEWSPQKLEQAEALRRAELYLQSMPQWAN